MPSTYAPSQSKHKKKLYTLKCQHTHHINVALQVLLTEVHASEIYVTTSHRTATISVMNDGA